MIPSFGLERDGQFPQQSVSLHLVVVVVELDLYDRHVDRLLAGDDA